VNGRTRRVQYDNSLMPFPMGETFRVIIALPTDAVVSFHVKGGKNTTFSVPVFADKAGLGTV